MQAACIEVFSAVGVWEAAAQIAGYLHDAMVDSTRMRVRKQYAQLTILAIKFERHLAEGSHSDAIGCAARWRHILEEVERSRSNE